MRVSTRFVPGAERFIFTFEEQPFLIPVFASPYLAQGKRGRTPVFRSRLATNLPPPSAPHHSAWPKRGIRFEPPGPPSPARVSVLISAESFHLPELDHSSAPRREVLLPDRQGGVELERKQT